MTRKDEDRDRTPEGPGDGPDYGWGKDAGDLRAVVFDLDDTLFPQIEWKRSGFRAVGGWLAERGFDREAAAEALSRALAEWGPSHPRLFDEALGRLGAPRGWVPEMVGVFRAHTPRLNAYPGVEAMLARLRGQGFLLGLLTDGLASVQRKKVEALGLFPCFDALLFTDEVGTSKPDPRVFVWFEERFALSGRELAYVADNPAKDFIGAKQRGWKTIRVLTGEYANIAVSRDMDAGETEASATEWARKLDEPDSGISVFP